VDITDKLLPGLHKVSSDLLRKSHTLIIEAFTTSAPPRKFVLYGPGYVPWINETGKSLTIDDMNILIAGKTSA
jgi:hypothetical protein